MSSAFERLRRSLSSSCRAQLHPPSPSSRHGQGMPTLSRPSSTHSQVKLMRYSSLFLRKASRRSVQFWPPPLLELTLSSCSRVQFAGTGKLKAVINSRREHQKSRKLIEGRQKRKAGAKGVGAKGGDDDEDEGEDGEVEIEDHGNKGKKGSVPVIISEFEGARWIGGSGASLEGRREGEVKLTLSTFSFSFLASL